MTEAYGHTPETLASPQDAWGQEMVEVPSSEAVRNHHEHGQAYEFGVADIGSRSRVAESVSDDGRAALSILGRVSGSARSLYLETAESLRPYHPGITVTESAGYKIKRIAEAARKDYSESDSKRRTGVLGGLAVATQVLDRFRVGVVLVPKVATEVLENTYAIKPTAAAAAATFMAWNFTVGEVLNYGLEEYPRTVDQFKEEFPTFVALFEQSLPGMRQDTEEHNPDSSPSLGSRAIKKFSTHTKRALSGISLGSTAYVATAAAQGRTRAERTRINTEVTAATGLLIGGLGASVAWSVLELPKRGHAWAATKISDTVSNMKIWWGVAASMIGVDYYLNKKQVE